MKRSFEGFGTMYSMVMMMAIAGAGDTASFGGKKMGCCGGEPVMASSGCCGGGFLGLKGKLSGLFAHKKMGCHGSSCHGGEVAPVCDPCAMPEPAPVACPTPCEMPAAPCALPAAPGAMMMTPPPAMAMPATPMAATPAPAATPEPKKMVEPAKPAVAPEVPKIVEKKKEF